MLIGEGHGPVAHPLDPPLVPYENGNCNCILPRHLECHLHQKLIIFGVLCKECLLERSTK